MPDPIITLKAGGLELTSFDALTVQRDLDAMADAFSFTCPSRPEIRAAIKPKGYTPAEVWFGSSRIITGLIDKPSSSMAQASLSLEGRSLSGQLVDCSMPTGRTQWGKLTLGALGGELARPFGLTVSMPQGDSAKLGDPVVSQDTDTPAAFMQRLAQDMGWLWHANTAGMPELIRPNPKGKPMANLVEGLGSFLDLGVSADGTGLYSLYEVVTTMGGWDKHPTGTATDPGVRLFRPHRRTGSDANDLAAKQSAAMDRGQSFAAAIGLQAEVGDWTSDAGEMWEPGRLITVNAPTCWIERPFLLMIAGVTFTLDASGRRASLRLILPGTYSGELPGVWPWD